MWCKLLRFTRYLYRACRYLCEQNSLHVVRSGSAEGRAKMWLASRDAYTYKCADERTLPIPSHVMILASHCFTLLPLACTYSGKEYVRNEDGMLKQNEQTHLFL